MYVTFESMEVLETSRQNIQQQHYLNCCECCPIFHFYWVSTTVCHCMVNWIWETNLAGKWHGNINCLFLAKFGPRSSSTCNLMVMQEQWRKWCRDRLTPAPQPRKPQTHAFRVISISNGHQHYKLFILIIYNPC